FVHTEGVAGSIPASPTRFTRCIITVSILLRSRFIPVSILDRLPIHRIHVMNQYAFFLCPVRPSRL
ncbi:MAG: hypothetical protein ABF747_04760, partial [Bifidobacterium sp.]|uniref:hypothetical protein n=1 Tax=Bifidobacterium sp. TaxID=41200 RepID=UPI0039EC32E9